MCFAYTFKMTATHQGAYKLMICFVLLVEFSLFSICWIRCLPRICLTWSVQCWREISDIFTRGQFWSWVLTLPASVSLHQSRVCPRDSSSPIHVTHSSYNHHYLNHCLMVNWILRNKERTSVKYESNYKIVQLKKMLMKMLSAKWQPH